MILQTHRQVPAIVFRVKLSLKRLLEGFFELVSDFIEARKKLLFRYHNSKLFQKL
jgi:hypothetical protein